MLELKKYAKFRFIKQKYLKYLTFFMAIKYKIISFAVHQTKKIVQIHQNKKSNSSVIRSAFLRSDFAFLSYTIFIQRTRAS